MSDLSLSIAAEPFDSDDAVRLVSALDASLTELYPPEQRFGPNLKAAHVEEGNGAFLVARDGGVAVGCGAVRLNGDGSAELKRMWVEPGLRGRGIGKALVAALEEAARRLGATRLVLETGVKQLEAIGLYRGAGFEECPCWGEYATSPSSICYEKTL